MRAWKQALSPTPAGGATLRAVASVSATGAWAVGFAYRPQPAGTTLILRWNGTAWK